MYFNARITQIKLSCSLSENDYKFLKFIYKTMVFGLKVVENLNCHKLFYIIFVNGYLKQYGADCCISSYEKYYNIFFYVLFHYPF